MKKNLNWLAKEICSREGKKKQVDIAQVKEILRCLVDMIREDSLGVASLLLKAAVRKIRRKSK